MKLEIETKYDVGQKVYVVDQDSAFEYRVCGVTIKAIVTRSQHVNGELRYRNMYLYDPANPILINDHMMFESGMFKTKEEAQAEADRLNRLWGERNCGNESNPNQH